MINVADIKEHMEVVGYDGEHVGKVDHVHGGEIELAKFDWGSGLKHHLIPISWIDHVDEHVHLTVTKAQAKAQWREKN